MAQTSRNSPVFVAPSENGRAKGREALDLPFDPLGPDVQVQMHTILDRLAFGHSLEVEPRANPAQIATRGARPEFGRIESCIQKLLQISGIPLLLLITQGRSPERCERLRVVTID